MNKVLGLCFMLVHVHLASTRMLGVDKGILPQSQTDSDPVCSDIPVFRQCYSDFLLLLGITNIAQPYTDNVNDALQSRPALMKMQGYFETFHKCVITKQLENCVSITTFKTFGINDQGANIAVWNYMMGTYIFTAGYQVYYDNFDCINAHWKSDDYKNTPKGIACTKARESLNHNQTCSMHDNYLRVCLQFWDQQCQKDEVGAFYCNFVYITDSWNNYGSTPFSKCDNVCPEVASSGTESDVVGAV